MKKSNWNLGKKGWFIILLSFLSIYINSAMTSDSLNVTIAAFAERGLNASILYSLSTVATVCAVIGPMIFGKVMQMKTVRMVWGISMLITVPFAILWGNAHSIAVYTIAYLVCYVAVMVFHRYPWISGNGHHVQLCKQVFGISVSDPRNLNDACHCRYYSRTRICICRLA